MEERIGRKRAPNTRPAVGRAGEEAAAGFFLRSGFRLLERNWRCRLGEIDLVLEDGETIVFAEVRSRTNPSRYGTAAEAVTPRKCRQVREVAAVYLKLRDLTGKAVRFDAVAVTFRNNGEVSELKHFPGAF